MMRFLLICFLTAWAGASQASCVDSIDPTMTSDDFTLNNGVATDNRTRLMWMRCALGQSWDASNETCTGDATPMNWQQALQASFGYQFQGYSGWRLPNVKELASLVERQCVRPAINATVFPATVADDFWSATPSMHDPLRAWVVAFYNGSNALKDKTLSPFVRLVRTAD